MQNADCGLWGEENMMHDPGYTDKKAEGSRQKMDKQLIVLRKPLLQEGNDDGIDSHSGSKES